MKKWQINELLWFLKADTNLTPIFWANVFYWLPYTEPSATFLSFNILANKKKGCYHTDLLEFKIVWSLSVTENIVMKEYLDKLEDTLNKNNKALGTLQSLVIQSLNDEYLWINKKERKEMVKSFSVSYVV